MTIIEQIKAEIERRKGAEHLAKKPIYSFDELDHEADDWIGVLRTDSGTNNDWNIGDIYRTAQHFAQWGAEQQKEHDDKLVDIIYQQGIEKGKDDMRKQMIKEFETWLKGNLHHLSCWNADEFCTNLKCYLGIKNEQGR